MTTATDEKLTDPYGDLEFAVGSGNDFWCFAYYVDTAHDRVRLHAAINSETGSFIEDAEPPRWTTYTEAVADALRLVDAALEWCAVNNVRHSIKGWRQDPEYFARAVAQAVHEAVGGPQRRVPRTSRHRLEV